MMDEFGRLPNDVIKQIKDFYQSAILSLEESDDNVNPKSKWVNLVITYPDRSKVKFDMHTYIRSTFCSISHQHINKYINHKDYNREKHMCGGTSIFLYGNYREEINNVTWFIEVLENHIIENNILTYMDNINNDNIPYQNSHIPYKNGNVIYQSYYYDCGDSNDSSDDELETLQIIYKNNTFMIESSHKYINITLPFEYKQALIKVFREYLVILNKYNK